MIQGATGSAVKANEAITKKIGEINPVTASIASAIEEQNAATQEVNQNITMLSDASVETEGMAKDGMQASSELSQQAELHHELPAGHRCRQLTSYREPTR